MRLLELVEESLEGLLLGCVAHVDQVQLSRPVPGIAAPSIAAARCQRSERGHRESGQRPCPENRSTLDRSLTCCACASHGNSFVLNDATIARDALRLSPNHCKHRAGPVAIRAYTLTD